MGSSVRGQVPPFDARAVGGNLLAVTRWAGVFVAVPAVVALAAGEWEQLAVHLGLGALVFGIGATGWLLSFPPLTERDAIAVAALAYLLVSLVGAVPFLTHVPPLDALFESMSGVTTTGLTMVVPERLPRSLVFHRAWSQWVGGAGILVLSVAILGITGKASVRLYRSQLGMQELADSLRSTIRFVLRVYGGLTAIGLVVLLVAGVPPFTALILVLTTVSTGGFSDASASIGDLHSPWVRVALMGLMVLGATSFVLLYRIRRDGWGVFLKDLQIRHLIGILAASVLLFWLAADGQHGLDGAFHAVSALTTTGFSIGSPERWPDGTRLVAVGLMVIGGAAGSTAGGIKLWRFALLAKTVRWLSLRTLLPARAKLRVEYGGKSVSDEELRTLLAFVAMYVGLLFVSAAALVFGGASISAAIFDCTSALGTVGLSAGVATPELHWWGKIVLIVLMWAGRLEILPVLVLFVPGVWTRVKGAP